jgi:hypothetical protein
LNGCVLSRKRLGESQAHYAIDTILDKFLIDFMQLRQTFL